MRLVLPGVNGTGHGVVTVVHCVRGPAVTPHVLGTVFSGHGQVLETRASGGDERRMRNTDVKVKKKGDRTKNNLK